MTVHGSRQICLDISALMHAKMTERAKQAGVPVARYATALLEAAYAARCGKSMGDGELDAWVGACILLYGGGCVDGDDRGRARGDAQDREQDAHGLAPRHFGAE